MVPHQYLIKLNIVQNDQYYIEDCLIWNSQIRILILNKYMYHGLVCLVCYMTFTSLSVFHQHQMPQKEHLSGWGHENRLDVIKTGSSLERRWTSHAACCHEQARHIPAPKGTTANLSKVRLFKCPVEPKPEPETRVGALAWVSQAGPRISSLRAVEELRWTQRK